MFVFFSLRIHHGLNHIYIHQKEQQSSTMTLPKQDTTFLYINFILPHVLDWTKCKKFSNWTWLTPPPPPPTQTHRHTTSPVVYSGSAFVSCLEYPMINSRPGQTSPKSQTNKFKVRSFLLPNQWANDGHNNNYKHINLQIKTKHELSDIYLKISWCFIWWALTFFNYIYLTFRTIESNKRFQSGSWHCLG